jgi:hypothetical protein
MGDGKLATPVRTYVVGTASGIALPFTTTSRTVLFAALCVMFSAVSDMTDDARSPSTKARMTVAVSYITTRSSDCMAFAKIAWMMSADAPPRCVRRRNDLASHCPYALSNA